MTSSTLIHKPKVPNTIKELIHGLLDKKYRISFIPEKIIYMNNGIEYYYIEVEGTDSSKFIINAYGSEAQDLFEEAHRCVICGRRICGKDDKTIMVRYRNDEKRDLFVEAGCMKLLKKFEIVYGKEFLVPWSLQTKFKICLSTIFNINQILEYSLSNQDVTKDSKSLLTLPNIQYLVQGLDVLLQTDLDGDKRTKVIQLRDELLSYINSIFTDYE